MRKSIFLAVIAIFVLSVSTSGFAYWKTYGAGGQRVGFASVYQTTDPITGVPNGWFCEGSGLTQCPNRMPVAFSNHQNCEDAAIYAIQNNTLSGSWHDTPNNLTATWSATDEYMTDFTITIQ
jgi:hypothetical protein